MNLSRAQNRVLNDMMTAPEYDMGNHQWCDTHLIQVGNETFINGNWNSTTLKALERKGFISIIKDGGWWSDIIQLKDRL
ncbi:MAG: hypothetical protein KAS32_03440 [Candidatus Peribacteraceae bacterium]|nr:hypothetical protein [Candidatus Peribacteraceae bacterium]